MKFKKIIASAIAISLALCLAIPGAAYQSNQSYSVSPASDSTITYEGQIVEAGICYTLSFTKLDDTTYNRELTFTPSESGMYKFEHLTKNQALNEEFFYNSGEDLIVADARWENNPINIAGRNMAVLESGVKYNISIRKGIAEHEDISDFIDTIEIYPMTVETLSFGNNILLSSNRDVCYRFVPEKNADFAIYMLNDDAYVLMYGGLDGDYIFTKGDMINLKVEQGVEYIISAFDETRPLNDFSWQRTDACVDILYLNEADNTTVYATDKSQLKSNHYYENNLDKTYVYTGSSDTLYTEITFSENSKLYGDSWHTGDIIYVYDCNNEKVAEYDYKNTITNKKLTLPGNTFSIKMITNSSHVDYGFEVSELIEHKGIAVPTSNIPSGTIRPSQIVLSSSSELSDIYYKIETSYDAGEYIKYIAPFEIDEDCKLHIYAEQDGIKSEAVTYEYTIDTSELESPEFTITYQGDDGVKFALIAPEGDIYYKSLIEDKYSKYTGQRYYRTSTVIAAYAQSGILKSDIVYLRIDVPDKTENEIPAPVITKTPVPGGFEVVVTPVAGEPSTREESINYEDDHTLDSCIAGYGHYTMPYSYTREVNALHIRYGSDSKYSNLYHTDTSYLPDKYIFTENTFMSVQSQYEYTTDTGNWVEDTDMYWHYKSGGNYNGDYKYSMYTYEYIEVPKASTPQITLNNGKLNILPVENCDIYYSVNGGEYTKYNDSFDADEHDIINAYAIGMGIAKSDIAVFSGFAYSINIDSEDSVAVHNNIRYNNVSSVVVALYDKLSNILIGVKEYKKPMKDVTTYIPIDISGYDLTDVKHPSVRVYVWDSMDSLKPLAKSQEISLTK